MIAAKACGRQPLQWGRSTRRLRIVHGARRWGKGIGTVVCAVAHPTLLNNTVATDRCARQRQPDVTRAGIDAGDRADPQGGHGSSVPTIRPGASPGAPVRRRGGLYALPPDALTLHAIVRDTGDAPKHANRLSREFIVWVKLHEIEWPLESNDILERPTFWVGIAPPFPGFTVFTPRESARRPPAFL